MVHWYYNMENGFCENVSPDEAWRRCGPTQTKVCPDGYGYKCENPADRVVFVQQQPVYSYYPFWGWGGRHHGWWGGHGGGHYWGRHSGGRWCRRHH